MKLAIIAAIGRNNVIGYGGKLPWHISEDLKRFKRLTTGHTILMGRKTFESIGKPLVNRRNVVVSSKVIEGVETYPTIKDALSALAGEELVFVIGGGQIYAQLLNNADALYLTFVDADIHGDTFFPPYEDLLHTRFRMTKEEKHDGYSFVDFERLQA